jgi:ferredoxin
MAVRVDAGRCVGCGGCVGICPAGALRLDAARPVCDVGKCTNCQTCVRFCPVGALTIAAGGEEGT